VVLAVGNRLIYADSYEDGLAKLSEIPIGAAPAPVPAAKEIALPPPSPQKNQDPRIENVRQHLQRYRDLTAQGKWADAGRELEAIQNEVQK
jgi:uncharacterized protein